MANKKQVEVEFEKDDPKAVYLELFDKNTELKSLVDEIQNISSEKDLALMKCDKDIYKSAEPLYRERRALLLEIPDFWSITFANLFLTLGFVDELTMSIHDFFVEDTENEFKLYFDFLENNIISNKQVIITVQTPSTPEELTQEIKITATPIELKKKEETKKKPDNNEEDEDDDEKGFLKFLLSPTKDVATFIVGSVWSNPLALISNDLEIESGDDDEEEEEDN